MPERSLNSILSEINTDIKDGVSFGNKITTYGLCDHLVIRGETVPVLNIGSGDGKIIEWNDKETLRIYHRLIDVVEENEDNSEGFGSKRGVTLIYPVRMVAIGTRDFLTTAGYEDNQDFARDVSKVFTRVTSNKELITKGEHETRKPVVYAEEYPNVDQEKLTLDGIAFWINYTITQRYYC